MSESAETPESAAIQGLVPAGERWQRWKRLNNEGVRLLQAGDADGAAKALTAAHEETLVDDVDTEGLARRASTLLNLASLAEYGADLDRSIRLSTEAIELTLEVERAVGDHFSTRTMRANAYATRAQFFLHVGRGDDAFDDVDRGLAAVATADSQRELITITLHNVRTGLLMATGRLAEAEEEALGTAELALAHAPELATYPYANLALLAEAAGEDDVAETYRRLAEGGGVRPLHPRWHRCVELNQRGAALAQSGDRRGALDAFDEAHRETLDSDDPEALVCRATIAGNRAGLAAAMGDFDDALRWSTEAVDLARRIEARVGNTYGTTADRANALGTRAQYLRYRSRFAEALADLDEAFDALDSVAENRDQLAASLHTVRTSVLVAAGRFEEGAAEARRALELAQDAAPHLVPYPHVSLAEIAGGTGDNATSAEHFQLARELFAATGDHAGEGAALLSLGRLAYLDDRNDDADGYYDVAEQLFRRAGNTVQLTTCLHGRAAVAVRRDRPREALTLLDRVLEALGDDAPPVALVSTYQVQGSAFEMLGDFARAQELYDAAREASERAGLWQTTLAIDWWRADALTRRAASTEAEQDRLELRRRALDLALPAALAAEAVRQRFSPGPLRERWVALAAAPATRAAFVAIASLGDVELAAAYIDHTAGTVSFRADSPPVDGTLALVRGEILALPEPAPEPARHEAAEHLPFAAAAFAGPADPAFPPPVFAVAPRVRLDPAVPTVLDTWIDVAEARYGLAVRSAEAVSSW